MARIIPLHSTRTDVTKLFGKPLFRENTPIGITMSMRADKHYVCRSAMSGGLPSNWGNWNVPVGTVVDVTIHFKDPMRLEDLKIADIENASGTPTTL